MAITTIKDVENINFAIQILLKADNHYTGDINGKIDEATITAIQSLLKSYKIDTKGWNSKRLTVAAEQAVYRSMKLSGSSGLDIDGLVGPQTNYVREAYTAQLATTWRDRLEDIIEARAKPAPKPEPAVSKPVKETPASNWPRQSDCTSFYGKPGSNQVTLNLPYPMRIAWEPKQVIRSWSCHRKVHDNMERIFQRTLDFYGMERIRELRLDMWGGTLNVRKMRGGSSWSMHSWGAAVDIDPDRNGLKTSWKNAQMSKPAYKKFVEFWYDEGAINLGVERNYDPMHFQFMRL